MRNTMQKKTRLSLIALAMSAVFLLPGVAGAAMVCTDDGELEALYDAINEAYFSGKNHVKDKAYMLRKYDYAVIKLGLGKYDDAIGKFMDISEKATYMSTATKQKQKLEPLDAESITDAVDSVLCIS